MPFRCTFQIAAIENSELAIVAECCWFLANVELWDILRLHGPHMLMPGRLAAELGSHTRSGSALIAFLSGRPRIPWFFTHWQDALIWFNLLKHFWICNYISLQTVQYLQSRKTGHSGRSLQKSRLWCCTHTLLAGDGDIQADSLQRLIRLILDDSERAHPSSAASAVT